MTFVSQPDFLWWPVATWETIAALVQTAALLVGGAWAYLRFVKGRLWYPRASLRHTISHRPVEGGRVLLRVHTGITNSGNVILPIRDAIFRVQQVLPLADEVLRAVQAGEDAVEEGALEVVWPGLAERVHKWPPKEIEIEPGETDEIICDFVLDEAKDIETVQVYGYFENSRKRRRRRPIGWGLATLYDMSPAAARVVERKVDDLTGRRSKDGEETASTQAEADS